MPFAKRIVEPQLLCRHTALNDEGVLFDDLCTISNVALSRTVRQLSDLAKHACSLFQELEGELVSTNHRVRSLRAKIGRIQQSASELDPKQEAVPVSNLDVECRLSGHYQSAWPAQKNVFLPASRPPCVDDLHHQAKQSQRALCRDQQQRQEVSERERRVTASISMAPAVPVYPSPHAIRNRERLQTFERAQSSSPTECCHFTRWSRKATADPDQEDTLLGQRSRFPVPNVPSVLDKQTNWTGTLPLPTPEDRMKSQSRTIASCVVPIDVTEEVPIDAPPSEMAAFLRAGFDREASVRYSLVHSQSVLQRRRKPRRRKTVVGVPRRDQNDADSDESPRARARTIVQASPDDTKGNLTLARLHTRDSGCQTDDLLASAAAPSHRRIRAQRGQGAAALLSHSTGNISSLPDDSDTTFSASVSSRLRSRSLPREGRRLADEGRDESNDEDEEEEEELSPFEPEDFFPVPMEHMVKDDEDSTDDQAAPERQLGGLKFKPPPECPAGVWMERGGPRLPHKADVECCEISSSSDTFSSPIHSNAGVLTSQMDHKDDHQSSSGNWSGSSSTCPSQTSETMPPAVSPPLTGSSHCDSELSLNAAPNTGEDQAGFTVDPYSRDQLQELQTHRAGSCASPAMDMLDDAGVSTASDGEWSYPRSRHVASCHPDCSPEHSRGEEGSLDCPSFTSIATLESLDKPPSEKADTTSHFSVDVEGYYTSMHFDCGLKGSKSFTHNYASVDQPKEEHSGPTTLGRQSLSLRKPKVKPAPPKRSTSLRKINSVGAAAEPNEPKISRGQHLPLSSRERRIQSGPSERSAQAEGQECLEVWGVQGLSDTQDDATSSTDTHSFKDEGAVQADYADLWLLNDLKSSDPFSNSSTDTGTTVVECVKSQESSESLASQPASRATTPSLPTVEEEFRLPSPEKLVGLASPSSGYSSQSETPTSCIPLAFFPNPNPLSPTHGKRKPKVPERKSSLVSLQQHISKENLELPVIPPTHLNLSALHKVSKPSTYSKPTPILLHQNIAAAKVETGSSSTTNTPPDGCTALAITPTVLRSVQLRSVGKPVEGKHDTSPTDAATRPKCPTLTAVSAYSSSKPKKPPPYSTLITEASSQENCPSPSAPVDRLAFVSLASHVAARNRYDRLAPAPLWNMAVSSTTSEEVSQEDVTADVSQNAVGHQAPAKQQTSTTKKLSTQSSVGTDVDQPVTSEQTEKGTSAESLLGHRSIVKRSDPNFDQVPDFIHQSSLDAAKNLIADASSQEDETMTPGVPTRSASEESVEEDTEGYFSKESTPSDPVVSPLTEESRMEDSVFLSPSKSRTTEDLFAMIHRSKRKVFGRKDSGESPAQRRLSSPSSPPTASPSTPVAPTTPTNSQRSSGPIYRSVKKSSTSNEEFKLLLLKKGSRTDSSYRMSATEILKSPILPKSFRDSLLEDPRQPESSPSASLLLSPERSPEHLPSPYPKVAVEGFSMKPFPSNASSRPGRSRIPPGASSSRYGTRSRLYTAPMQAISEGETENSDGSPHDDRSS